MNESKINLSFECIPEQNTFEDNILKTVKSTRDIRPTLDGWSPGVDLNKCRHCGKYFLGNPSSITCADCAYTFVLVKSENNISIYKCRTCSRHHINSTSNLNYHYSDCDKHHRKNNRH